MAGASAVKQGMQSLVQRSGADGAVARVPNAGNKFKVPFQETRRSPGVQKRAATAEHETNIVARIRPGWKLWVREINQSVRRGGSIARGRNIRDLSRRDFIKTVGRGMGALPIVGLGIGTLPLTG